MHTQGPAIGKTSKLNLDFLRRGFSFLKRIPTKQRRFSFTTHATKSDRQTRRSTVVTGNVTEISDIRITPQVIDESGARDHTCIDRRKSVDQSPLGNSTLEPLQEVTQKERETEPEPELALQQDLEKEADGEGNKGCLQLEISGKLEETLLTVLQGDRELRKVEKRVGARHQFLETLAERYRLKRLSVKERMDAMTEGPIERRNTQKHELLSNQYEQLGSSRAVVFKVSVALVEEVKQLRLQQRARDRQLNEMLDRLLTSDGLLEPSVESAEAVNETLPERVDLELLSDIVFDDSAIDADEEDDESDSLHSYENDVQDNLEAQQRLWTDLTNQQFIVEEAEERLEQHRETYKRRLQAWQETAEQERGPLSRSAFDRRELIRGAELARDLQAQEVKLDELEDMARPAGVLFDDFDEEDVWDPEVCVPEAEEDNAEAQLIAPNTIRVTRWMEDIRSVASTDSEPAVDEWDAQSVTIGDSCSAVEYELYNRKMISRFRKMRELLREKMQKEKQ